MFQKQVKIIAELGIERGRIFPAAFPAGFETTVMLAGIGSQRKIKGAKKSPADAGLV
jgi:hypothetical protein